MPRQILVAHRLERASADMQRHAGDGHAPLLESAQQRRIEVQASGRCRHRARGSRIHGLVALLVVRIGPPLDVGRQRHLPVPIEHDGHRRIECEEVEVVATLQHANAHASHRQRTIRLERLAGPHLAQRLRLALDALDENLRLPARILHRRKPRLHHLRVVHHQQIALAQQLDDRIETAMANTPFAKHEQPTCRTGMSRPLRNQRRGQVEVEIAPTERRVSHRQRPSPPRA